MTDRSAIESEVRDSIEIHPREGWYVAEAEYNGWTSATIRGSPESAIRQLVSKFYERERDKRLLEDRRKHDREIMEQRQELDVARRENIDSMLERERQSLDERLDG